MMRVVLPFAALAGPLPKAGVIVVAALAAVALLSPEERIRASAMLAALVLAPVLLLADIWHSPQLGIVHHHPLLAAAVAVLVVAAIVAVSVLIARHPWLLAALVVVALPFRVPIQAGGTTSNLLVPLYLVVASGVLSFVVPALAGAVRERPWAPDRSRWVERLLALYVVLYAVQSIYSADFEKALQQMVFFYVPFALLFCLLRRLEWNARLLRICLVLVASLAVLFALVGFVEYATKTIILNPRLVVENDLHAYFTVNSVFFDPDIFGRFLALVMILLAALLLRERDTRRELLTIAALAVLWGGLVLTLSRSSLAALLVGLAVLAALRWKPSRAALAAAVVVAIGIAAIAISPKTFGLNQGLNGASSGRAGLVSGGIQLFEDRPVWGWGSGSFVTEYRAHHPHSSQTLSASHTISITIAAEQGLIGEGVYLALVLAALLTLCRGARSSRVRAAIAAAFVALVFHTWLYADFLEDPVTWTLLGIGTALAVASRPGPRERVGPEPDMTAVPA